MDAAQSIERAASAYQRALQRPGGSGHASESAAHNPDLRLCGKASSHMGMFCDAILQSAAYSSSDSGAQPELLPAAAQSAAAHMGGAWCSSDSVVVDFYQGAGVVCTALVVG